MANASSTCAARDSAQQKWIASQTRGNETVDHPSLFSCGWATSGQTNLKRVQPPVLTCELVRLDPTERYKLGHVTAAVLVTSRDTAVEVHGIDDSLPVPWPVTMSV